MRLEIVSSRRLTGGNLYGARAGVVLDVELDGIGPEHAIAAWQSEAAALTAGLGWDSDPIARPWRGGASLFFEAPLDALLRATEVNEVAWARACATLAGEPLEPLDGALNVFAQWFDAERDAPFTRLAAASARRGVTCLWDDDAVTLGVGAASATWPRSALPDPDTLDWATLGTMPFAMITGTNGKSTTVRLLAAIMAAAGKTVGFNCTDGVVVDGDIIDEGDYAGPAGARAVLSDRRVELAAIEVARGGLLRRGVALDTAPVVAVTNIAEDHLGEYGIDDVDALAEAKFVLLRALRPGGTLVANADDARVVRHAEASGHPVCWFSLDASNPRIRASIAHGEPCWYLDDGALVTNALDAATRVVDAAAIPVTMNGHAAYNVANALTAAAAAAALGLPVDAIRAGLEGFKSENADNPGRGNLYSVDGARVLVDFAHNVHGIDAVVRTVKAFPARRRLLMFGQAGHRSDAELAAITDAALKLDPERIVLTDSEHYRRGREPMAVPRRLRELCVDRGVDPARISLHASPLEGVEACLAWAGDGDACLLLTLGDRDRIAELLHSREAESRPAGSTAGAGP